MNDTAKFVQGKLMRHIVVMSTTSAVGLMSIFFVDLLDMFFISLLGDPDLVAGIGIAGTLTFLVTSISIGTSIAAGALVSKSVGAKQVQKAREYAVNVLLIAALISIGSIAVGDALSRPTHRVNGRKGQRSSIGSRVFNLGSALFGVLSAWAGS